MSEPEKMTAEEAAAKREAAIEGMVAKGYTRERAEELLGLIGKTLFGPGGRFAKEGDQGDAVNPNHTPRVAASKGRASRAPELRSIAKAIQPAFPTAAQLLREIASELDEGRA